MKYGIKRKNVKRSASEMVNVILLLLVVYTWKSDIIGRLADGT